MHYDFDPIESFQYSESYEILIDREFIIAQKHHMKLDQKGIKS